MLCKYKNMFGEVGTGIHSIRVFNIAIIDVFITLFAAYLINIYVPNYNYFIILFLLFTLGIILHKIFCVETTVDKILFK